MNPLARFLRFNLVGLIGIAVQLTTLALLNHALPRHYLLTSTLAVELAILHNFAWHIRFTWPATNRTPRATIAALLRFQLSNGLLSLTANLLLMRLFIHAFHAPVLLANALTLAISGLANFLLAHLWVFSRSTPRTRTRSHAIVSLVLAAAALFAQTAHPQSSRLPSNPSPSTRDYGVDSAYMNVFAGPAATISGATHIAGTAGITFGQYAARPRHIAPSPQFELGILSPIAGRPLDGLVSADYMFAGKISHRNIFPSVTAGYTRFFVTGNAINFGVGVDLATALYKPLVRVEIRDYLVLSSPQQQIIGLRIALGKLIPD